MVLQQSRAKQSRAERTHRQHVSMNMHRNTGQACTARPPPLFIEGVQQQLALNTMHCVHRMMKTLQAPVGYPACLTACLLKLRHPQLSPAATIAMITQCVVYAASLCNASHAGAAASSSPAAAVMLDSLRARGMHHAMMMCEAAMQMRAHA
jgi:hypothetical protein